MRKAILKRSLLFYPINVLLCRIKNLVRIIKRFQHPTGMVISILGPDGSGKSTIARNISEMLGPVFRSTIIKHWRPGIFPEYVPSDGQVVNNEPHGKRERGIFLSSLKFIYYFLDYTLGYFLKILPWKIKSTLIIYDRYYYDFLIDPKRYRMSLPKSIIQAFTTFVPKPDIVIFLKADIDVILARKQEIEPHEIQHQNEQINYLAQLLRGHFYVVDANRSIAQIASSIRDIALNFMNTRYESAS